MPRIFGATAHSGVTLLELPGDKFRQLLANLVFKPIAVKLERRTEERLITMNMVLEGISLITKRRLPSFIEETLNSFVANYHDEIRDNSVKPRPDSSVSSAAKG